MGKPAGDARVKRAINQISDEELYLSVLSIGEIAKGIELLNAGKRKSELSSWLRDTISKFAGRILPVDIETTEFWGHMTARLQKSGITLPAIDGLLAASALRRYDRACI
jgi:toxin FitB